MTLLRPAFTLLLLFSLLTGVVYPLATAALGRLLFPSQSGGSLIVRDGRIVGSALIGQSFTQAGYFHGRPSAAGTGYDASASGGSNLAPSSRMLMTRVAADLQTRQAENPAAAVPADLVLASASGLDPHISPAAARFQMSRIAAARNLPVATLAQLIDEHQHDRWLGLLGEPRVDVLSLNLALDRLGKLQR